MWVFNSPDSKKETPLKVELSGLVGIENCIVSHALILKDAIILGIHNQLHVIAYNKTSLSSNWNKFTKELINHRIVKLEHQILKLWSLNDYHLIMIEYYGVNGLYIYKLVNQLKEIKNINKVKKENNGHLIFFRLNLKMLKIFFH